MRRIADREPAGRAEQLQQVEAGADGDVQRMVGRRMVRHPARS